MVRARWYNPSAMGAFAVIFQRTNTQLQPDLLERVMERLSHRGPDGSDTYTSERIAMGYWRFWTTPEEVGERQPLKLDEYPFRIVLDGRLDNRSELVPRLGLPASLSDAALILHAYARWGEDCFQYFVGEYAIVIHDESRNQLVCARDALGDRTLFYAVHNSHFIVASEPRAVAAGLPNVELDEEGLTYYFAFQPTPDGQTLFKHVRELLPAQRLTVSSEGETRRYYWSPDPARRTRYRHDEEYAEEFRALLEQSIRARMRSATPLGILMSGGLDSTSLACLTARMLAPASLKTISFVFDDPDLKSCDERIYMNAVREQWKTHSIQIPCDDDWPYKNWERWPQPANRPDGNVFRWVKERVYQRARQEGLRVLFTGEGGDHLYAAGQDWLSALLLEGRILDVLPGLALQVQRKGWRNVRIAGHIPRAARALLKQALPPQVVNRLRATPTPPPWLTPQAARIWKPETNRFAPSLLPHENLLSAHTAAGITLEIPVASRHSLELRHPYRDRRLIEYVLSLPAYQLYYGGLYKHILRNAMKGILPEIIRARPRPTALLPLYKLGLQKEQHVIQSCLQDPHAVWPQYVNAEWLRAHWQINAPAEQVGTESMIAWLCVSFESWYKYAVFSNC